MLPIWYNEANLREGHRMNGTCQACMYYLEKEPRLDGVCRFSPPVLVTPAIRTQRAAWALPVVAATDCCGQYKPAQSKKGNLK